MEKTNNIYHFGRFTLKLEDRQLLLDGEPVPVSPKAFDILAYLVANPGRLVTKTELLANVWPDTFVEEVTLHRTISDLRKALGGAQDPMLIQTVPKYGYRFGAPEQKSSALVTCRTVGREEELKQLRAAFDSVAAGKGAALTISGEAGIGKTTLGEDFLAEIEARGAAAWIGRGRCSERLAETDPFAPLLESLAGLMRGDFGSQAVEIMRDRAPTWYVQVAPATSDFAGGLAKDAKTASTERMRREFASFFEGLSRTRPVVLFLDDLHWADASTCDLLAYLAPLVRDLRILILGAYRPATALSGRHPFLALKLELDRRSRHQELPLSFLALPDVERYLGLEFPLNRFPDEFARVVHQRTEGNPLFMTDMLRFLRDRRIVMEEDGRWLLARPVAEIRQAVPIGIHSMIRLKISQFSEHDLAILHCAALQGMQFDSAVVAQVLALDPVDVEERLQELDTAHDFMRVVEERVFPNHTLSVRYRFVHVFYQNALWSALAPSRRAAQSLAIARTLAGLTGGATHHIAADLAMLFETGRDFASAARYFLQAAREAARVYAYPEAVILCQRGLIALASVPESRDRDSQELVCSLTLGMALMATRGYAAPEVESTHQRSRELCLKLNERRRLSSVLWGLHTCHTNRGDLVRALDVAREMRQVADAAGDAFAIIESLHALGTTLAFMGRLAEAGEALELIFSKYPMDQHTFRGSLYVLDPFVTSLSMLARLQTVLGCLDQAVQQSSTSVQLADRLAHPPSLAYATFWVGWIHHTRGDFAEACRHLESSMALSRKHGLPLFLEWGRIVRGSALVGLRKAGEGISEIRKSIERQNAMGAMLERSYCLTLLAEALGAQGACEEALNLCDEALAFARRSEGRSYEPETHRVRGEMLLLFGDDAHVPQAAAEFASALQLARQAGCRLFELRAALSQFRLHRRLGDAAAGRAALVEVLNGFSERIDSPAVVEARKLLAG